jgi:ribosomal protein S18 acetylase RimI-like enzyme
MARLASLASLASIHGPVIELRSELVARLLYRTGTRIGQHLRVSADDPVVIRRGRVSEVAEAVSVWMAANAARNLPNHPERLRTWGHGPDAVLHVADDHGLLVGMALRLPGRADDGAGAPIPGLCHLVGICVVPHRQGQHLGGRLLDAVLAGARQDGYVRATLWTHDNNAPALWLFEARGFRRTGRVAQDESGQPMIHLERD